MKMKSRSARPTERNKILGAFLAFPKSQKNLKKMPPARKLAAELFVSLFLQDDRKQSQMWLHLRSQTHQYPLPLGMMLGT